MNDTKTRIFELKDRFDKFLVATDLHSKKTRVNELQAIASESNFWDDQENARKIMQELGDLRKEIEEIEYLQKEIQAFFDFAQESEVTDEFLADIESLEKKMKKIEIMTFLSGQYDRKNAIVSIHAGQGGTEAMDWTSMLFRMYMRFAERREWKTEVIDTTYGEEAGIKSVIFKIEGAYAYGLLKREMGTHRLVRQSPFNADKLRQTSFALVEVMPELEELDMPDIKINDDDLEIQFFRSGGHGGQNVNKVSTAVRLKHIPTGVVVTAQTERFQEQNRKIAMSLLRSKLWVLEQERAIDQKKEIRGEYRPASWGTQIRSYVLHPYKMVKDLRTEVETGNPDAVLDGDLDEFIDAQLRNL